MAERDITRRTFLKGAAGLQLGLYVGALDGLPVVRKAIAPGASADEPIETVPLGIWLAVGADNSVTIVVPRPDMGQGTRTSLAMIVAEELDADWEMVRIEQAVADSKYGGQTAGGSTSTRNYWNPLRTGGATARAMLVAAAADAWGVDPGDCVTERCVVRHPASGRESTYGALAPAAAALPVPPASQVRLKSPSEYTLIGQAKPRVDNAAVVDGSAVFGWDVKVPGMLYAVAARPPTLGARLEDVDDSRARAVPGVRDVIRLGSWVAVLADHTWAALRGREALDVTWDTSPNADLDSEVIRARLRARAGTAPVPPAESVQVVEAAYDLPYLAHATMEPMNCVADVRDGRCTVWASTQAPGSVQRSAANAAGVPQSAVTVNVMLTGGGFGRRLSSDYAQDAATVSRRAGAPVQLVWTRDDDMRDDNYRPASHHALWGSLDADGKPVSYFHRMVKTAYGSGSATAEDVEPPRTDQAPRRYSIPRTGDDSVTVRFPISTGAWRSVDNTQLVFANESFIDELAAAAGRDPVEFRSALIGSSRLRGVLELAAERSGWGDPLPAGRGRGIACASIYGSHIAQVVELSVTAEGQVTVHRVVAAVDCGIAINPLGVSAQVEGATIDGLSTAFKAAITVAGGAIVESSFADYEWFRMGDEPTVTEVHIVSSEANPGGMGEVGYPCVAPAAANAVFAATGRRLRRLPMRAEDLAGAAPEPTVTPVPTATDEPEPTATPEPGSRLHLPRVSRNA